MANEITILNGITKREQLGTFHYQFPLASIVAYPNPTFFPPILATKGPYYSVRYQDFGQEIAAIAFADVPDNFGTTNIEEYVDYLATDTDAFREAVLGAGGGGPTADVNIVSNQTDFATETTLQAILTQLQSMACMLGWCYIISSICTIADNKQLIIKEEIIIEDTGELQIESTGKLFLEI